MSTVTRQSRHVLPVVAVMLAIGATLPPAETYARRYAVIQAVQFVLFAVVVPALLAIGWLRRSPAPPVRRPAKRADAPGVRAAVSVLPFLALVVVWRLPATLNALDRVPALTVAELVSLTGAGGAVWLELTAGRALRPPLPRPLRAAMAAVAMWTIWAVAYIFGMSGVAAAPAWAGAALSAADDRQLAVAVLWTVPALCFVPVIYGTLIGWLGERSEPDAVVPASGSHGPSQDALASPPRPPRGWRSMGGS